MLTQYNLKMPHAVYGGENAMDNITSIIKARGAKKVALFTDKGIEAAGLFALPEAAVKAAGAQYYVLDDLPAEPSYMAVQKLVDGVTRSWPGGGTRPARAPRSCWPPPARPRGLGPPPWPPPPPAPAPRSPPTPSSPSPKRS